MDTYPNVGMVSGYVIPSFFVNERVSANFDFAEHQPDASIQIPVEIPERWVADWAESTGREPGEALAQAKEFNPALLEFQGVKAYAAANHDQFLTRKEVMLEVLPKEWSGNLMGQMIEIDEAMNKRGYLRLATADRTCQHIGNILSEDIAARVEITEHAFSLPSATANSAHPAPTWFKRFLRWRPVRFVLLGLYSRLFHWINPD
jgi:hypothetical protein